MNISIFLLLGIASIGVPGDPAPEKSIPWTAQSVEHLFNRAGFGARPQEIQLALKCTPEEVVDKLLNGGKRIEPPHYTQGTLEDLVIEKGVGAREKRRVKAVRSRDNTAQLNAYTDWWLTRMVQHDDPLRDRMSLFWHGLFATSHSTVKRSYDMIEQHRMLRAGALENYGELLHRIVKDPAMIYYLDNHKNKKSAPNENLARELLELFSLGEGHYSEADIKEVARALTGEFRDKLGNYRYSAKDHDKGRKVVLGETGRFRAKDVVDILLRQTACARYIAGRLLLFMEGVEPDDLRLTEYAALLKRNKYELKPFLRKLLLDPRFYSERVIAARVAGPVDYMVGVTRRLAINLDPQFLHIAATELGQQLFNPPSVKGWDGGEAWIHTGSLLARGNTIGLMLDTIDLEETFRPLKKQRDPLVKPGKNQAESDGSMRGESMGSGAMMEGPAVEEDSRDNIPKELAVLVRGLGKSYRPSLNLTYRLSRLKKVDDEHVVNNMLDSLLAIEAPRETRVRVLDYFRGERVAANLPEEGFLEDSASAEVILRRLAHLILSLPEAQLL
jgi:uncharacterized protein (DUF1800 family)